MFTKNHLVYGIIIIAIIVILYMLIYKEKYNYPGSNFLAIPVDETNGLTSVSLPNTKGLLTVVTDSSGNLSTTSEVPIGAIIMWAGSVDGIPSGWALCDGSTTSSGIQTPDLRSRFIVGASNVTETQQLSPSSLTALPPGTTGGEEMHTLGITEIPSHTHTTPGSACDASNSSCPFTNGSLSQYANSEKSSATGGDPQNNNATAPHNNMPPFFALAFIMKVA